MFLLTFVPTALHILSLCAVYCVCTVCVLCVCVCVCVCRISDSRSVLGPYSVPAGGNMQWHSTQEDEFVDILALSDKPRTEHSAGYDVIIVTRTMYPKGDERPSRAMVFLASMCRLSSPGAIFAVDKKEPEQQKEAGNGNGNGKAGGSGEEGGGEEDKNKKNKNKIFPLTCVMQKAQSKTGIFNLEEVYGLDAVTTKKGEGEGKGEGNNL
jgi:hypothetical protein